MHMYIRSSCVALRCCDALSKTTQRLFPTRCKKLITRLAEKIVLGSPRSG